VNTEAIDADVLSGEGRGPSARQWLVACARRLIRAGTEAGYDAIVWVSGLCYVGWLTRGMAGIDASKPMLIVTVLLICLLSVLSGLLAGLYRGRHPRGSLDEMVSVLIAGGLMLAPLAMLSNVLFGRQPQMLRALLGAASIALPTIFVARYVVFAARHGRPWRHRKGPQTVSRSSSSVPARRVPR
jgi:hypothetical protein